MEGMLLPSLLYDSHSSTLKSNLMLDCSCDRYVSYFVTGCSLSYAPPTIPSSHRHTLANLAL